MTGLDALPRQAWLAYWRYRRRYHRYSVEGLEHLLVDEPRLIAGYHGRPLAYDMCILTVELYERLGYLPHGMVHRGVDLIPPMRWLKEALGFVVTDGPDLEAAVRRGEHLVTTPGGGEEGCRRYDDTYRVNWGDRVGYVRLAVKYGLQIVPVGAGGADDGFIGLNTGPVLGRALGLPNDVAWMVWLGVGPLGLWPLSPAFPARMHQIVGAPIDPRALGATSPDDRGALLRVHRHVVAAVQGLLDRARRRLQGRAGT
jgi:hypothetical protein